MMSYFVLRSLCSFVWRELFSIVKRRVAIIRLLEIFGEKGLLSSYYECSIYVGTLGALVFSYYPECNMYVLYGVGTLDWLYDRLVLSVIIQITAGVSLCV